MSYLFHLSVYLGIYVITAMSLNIVVGYCGLLTMAHAAYFAVGAYAYALVSLNLGWSFLPAALFGMGVAAVLSFCVSLPSWRFKGDFFVLVSLAAQVLIFSIIYNWANPNAKPGTLHNLTNGPFGLGDIPKPDLFGIRLNSPSSIAMLSIALAAGCALLSKLLLSSPWGRLLKATRDDEVATRELGKNTRLVKLQAFALACGMVGLAGSIYASYVSYIDPSSASLNESILMLCMVIVGGLGNLRGPLIGAFVLLAIPEVLRFVEVSDALAANFRLVVFGLLLVIMMHLRPKGLAGEYRVE
jgi:branched-chain amino acid transport system permease protein